MLANVSQCKARNIPPNPDLKFVESVKVRRIHSITASGWKRWVLGVFWSLMIIKCAGAHWAIVKWDVPVGPFWIWMPSMMAALLCTWVFVWRESLEAPGETPPAARRRRNRRA